MGLGRELYYGLVAGSAGTVALNMTTYGDMVLRGRPSSETPAKIAQRLAGNAGIALSTDITPAQERNEQATGQAQHRAQGLGALQGYMVGLGLGTLYGLLRPRLNLPGVLAGAAIGVAAMAASDVPSITIAGSDPRTWGISGWLADLIPHMAYGLTTALVFEQIRQR